MAVGLNPVRSSSSTFMLELPSTAMSGPNTLAGLKWPGVAK